MDNIGLPRNSCHADFRIANNDDNVIDAFVDDEMVVVSVDAAEPTDILGDNGHLFLWTLNDNNIKKHGPITHSTWALQQRHLSKKW